MWSLIVLFTLPKSSCIPSWVSHTVTSKTRTCRRTSPCGVCSVKTHFLVVGIAHDVSAIFNNLNFFFGQPIKGIDHLVDFSLCLIYLYLKVLRFLFVFFKKV